jgi:NADPH-dependent 2,4-dienoyl-CoA reductase/sulfur reductase-like enzyme
MRLRRVVVVGASLAGSRSAEALRRHGFDGDLTVVGAEEHPPYQRPPLSKQFLAGEWDRSKVDLRLRELDADLRLGTVAESIDRPAREVVVRDGAGRAERIGYDGLVIATGCQPRQLPGAPGTGEMNGVHTLRTIDDSVALRRELERRPRVCVVGAGFIGSEVAATCRRLGADVTLIDPLDAPLQRALGRCIGDVVAAVHRDRGVHLRMRTSVSGLVGNGEVEGVRLQDGEVVPADLVVVGLGVTPAVEWLEGSGVRIDDGVVCDDRCRVDGVENAVAAGDVARWHHARSGRHLRVEHFDNAAAQAVAAAQALLSGDDAPPYDPPLSFWSDQFDVKLQLLGLPDPDDTVRIVEGDVSELRFIAVYGREGRTASVLAANQPARLNAYRDAVAQRVAFPPPVPG